MTLPLWNDAAPLENRTHAENIKHSQRTTAKRSPIPPAHRNAPPGTSDAAARWVAPFTGGMRERVYAFIRSCGPLGATDDEGEAALNMRPQSYTPRRGELAKAGLIVMTGDKRPTASGCSAAVWVASEHAKGTEPLSEGGTHGNA